MSVSQSNSSNGTGRSVARFTTTATIACAAYPPDPPATTTNNCNYSSPSSEYTNTVTASTAPSRGSSTDCTTARGWKINSLSSSSSLSSSAASSSASSTTTSPTPPICSSDGTRNVVLGSPFRAAKCSTGIERKSVPLSNGSAPPPPPPPPVSSPGNSKLYNGHFYSSNTLNRSQPNGRLHFSNTNSLPRGFNSMNYNGNPKGYHTTSDNRTSSNPSKFSKPVRRTESNDPSSKSKVDPNDPQVRKLVYNMYRGLLDKKHEHSNSIINKLPNLQVDLDEGVTARVLSMMKQQEDLKAGKSGNMNGPSGPPPPPPPPPFIVPGMTPPAAPEPTAHPMARAAVPSKPVGPAMALPPAALAGAMMKDKKPFTYTPGGLDLSEIRSPRMQRRLSRNAAMDGPTPSPLAQPNTSNSAMPGGCSSPSILTGIAVQVLPMPGMLLNKTHSTHPSESNSPSSKKAPPPKEPEPPTPKSVCGPPPPPPPFQINSAGTNGFQSPVVKSPDTKVTSSPVSPHMQPPIPKETVLNTPSSPPFSSPSSDIRSPSLSLASTHSSTNGSGTNSIPVPPPPPIQAPNPRRGSLVSASSTPITKQIVRSPLQQAQLIYNSKINKDNDNEVAEGNLGVHTSEIESPNSCFETDNNRSRDSSSLAVEDYSASYREDSITPSMASNAGTDFSTKNSATIPQTNLSSSSQSNFIEDQRYSSNESLLKQISSIEQITAKHHIKQETSSCKSNGSSDHDQSFDAGDNTPEQPVLRLSVATHNKKKQDQVRLQQEKEQLLLLHEEELKRQQEELIYQQEKLWQQQQQLRQQQDQQRLQEEQEDKQKRIYQENEELRIKQVKEQQIALEQEQELVRVEREEQREIQEQEERERRIKEEQERQKRIQEDEQQKRIQYEQEVQKRIKEEQEVQKRIKEEQEVEKRIKEEQERQKQIQEEQERQNIVKEEHERQKRIKEEEERFQEEKRLKQDEQEKQKILDEEQGRQRMVLEEQERQKRVVEEQEQQRRYQEELEQKKQLQEDQEKLKRIEEERNEQRGIQEKQERQKELDAEYQQQRILQKQQQYQQQKQQQYQQSRMIRQGSVPLQPNFKMNKSQTECPHNQTLRSSSVNKSPTISPTSGLIKAPLPWMSAVPRRETSAPPEFVNYAQGAHARLQHQRAHRQQSQDNNRSPTVPSPVFKEAVVVSPPVVFQHPGSEDFKLQDSGTYTLPRKGKCVPTAQRPWVAKHLQYQQQRPTPQQQSFGQRSQQPVQKWPEVQQPTYVRQQSLTNESISQSQQRIQTASEAARVRIIPIMVGQDNSFDVEQACGSIIRDVPIQQNYNSSPKIQFASPPVNYHTPPASVSTMASSPPQQYMQTAYKPQTPPTKQIPQYQQPKQPQHFQEQAHQYQPVYHRQEQQQQPFLQQQQHQQQPATVSAVTTYNNTPIGLYSDGNAVEALQQMQQSLAQLSSGLQNAYPKFIQETISNNLPTRSLTSSPGPVCSGAEVPPMQSRSFRMLQNVVDTDASEPQGHKCPSKPQQQQWMQGGSAAPPSRIFRAAQPHTDTYVDVAGPGETDM